MEVRRPCEKAHLLYAGYVHFTVNWVFWNLYGIYIAPRPLLSWKKPEHYSFDNMGPWIYTSVCVFICACVRARCVFYLNFILLSQHAHTSLSLCSVSVQHAHTSLTLLRVCSVSVQHAHTSLTLLRVCSVSVQRAHTHLSLSLSLSASAQILFSVRQRRAELNSVKHRYYVACFSNFTCKYSQNHSTAIVIIL